MEKFTQEPEPQQLKKEERKKEQIPVRGNAEIWNDLLDLFGTEQARERFEKLCERYYGISVRNRVRAEQTAGAGKARSIASSDEYKAEIHNEIMRTIYRLMTQAEFSPAEKSKFSNLVDRNKVADMIGDVFGVHSAAEKKNIEQMTPLGKFRKL